MNSNYQPRVGDFLDLTSGEIGPATPMTVRYGTEDDVRSSGAEIPKYVISMRIPSTSRRSGGGRGSNYIGSDMELLTRLAYGIENGKLPVAMDNQLKASAERPWNWFADPWYGVDTIVRLHNNAVGRHCRQIEAPGSPFEAHSYERGLPSVLTLEDAREISELIRNGRSFFSI